MPYENFNHLNWCPYLFRDQCSRPYLTLEQSEWVENHDTVFFGYDPGCRPLEFIDKNVEHAGVTADYLTEIGEKSGINFQPYPNIKYWTQAEQLSQDKKVHFLPALAQNKRRETFLDFTKSFFSYSFVIVSQKESEFIGGRLHCYKLYQKENY